jgi:hypothetical protein
MHAMNSQQTRKPAFLERLLAVRPLWAVAIAIATLTSASMTAQVILTPDTTPVPPPKVEPTPERPAPPTPPAEPPPQIPGERPATIPPKTDGSDPAVSGPAAKAPVLDIIDLAGDEVYVSDASAADTLSRVEGELRKFLKISATEPGLRLRLRKPFAAGWVSGTWRYLSADHQQVWAMWAYPSNNPSALSFLATDRFIPTEVTEDAQLRDPANFTIGEERQLFAWDADYNGSSASWNAGRPLSFSAILVRDGSAASSLSVEKIKAALGSYPNLEIVSSDPSYFGISADYQTSSEFPGLQPILDVQRTLQALAKLAAAPAGTAPAVRPQPTDTPEEPGTRNPPPTQSPAVVDDILELNGGDKVFAPDASVSETIARVESELRKVLGISATEPGLRARVQAAGLLGDLNGVVAGIWRYLSADNLQVWAKWSYPSNNPSALNLFALYQYTGSYSAEEAEFYNPTNYSVSSEQRLYLNDPILGGLTASWTPGQPVNFWTLLKLQDQTGSSLSVEGIRSEFEAYPNLNVSDDLGSFVTISADFQKSPAFPGLQPILETQRTLRRIAKEGTRKITPVAGPVRPTEPSTPEKPAGSVTPGETPNPGPADRSEVSAGTLPAIKPEPPVKPALPPVRPEPVDGAVSEPAQVQPNRVNDIFTIVEGAAPFAEDATVTDIITRVEGQLRDALKLPATDTGLRVRVDRQPIGNRVTGMWRYLGGDDVQAFARWSYPSNEPSDLKLFAYYEYTGPLAETFEISPNNLICLMDPWSGVNTATWASNTPVRFSSTVSPVRPDGSPLTTDALRSAFSALSNLEVQGYENGYFAIAGDVSTSIGLSGIAPLIDVQRMFLAFIRGGTPKSEGTVMAPEAMAPTSALFMSKARALGKPTAPSAKADRPTEPATTETALTANGGLEGLTLQADNPKIEVAENRAYIPLFFTVLGTYTGTNDVVVRARFISGTATPGVDFELGEQERSLPAQGGLTTMAWIAVPTLLDEVNEGDETAVFEVFIVGSTNAPIRIEATLLEDSNPGQVGFVSTRFQINEGSTNGYAQIRLWRTLNTRQVATISYRLEGPASALAVLGGQTRRTATFQPGDSQVFVQIPLVNDTTAQGTQDVTLTLEPAEGGLKLMKGFESTVLTLADDETPSPAEPLNISQYDAGGGQRGVMLSTRVARGYQVLLECSDTGAAGPWRPYWRFEGADVERVTFDSFDTSVMRMYRILPPEPLDMTFPW